MHHHETTVAMDPMEPQMKQISSATKCGKVLHHSKVYYQRTAAPISEFTEVKSNSQHMHILKEWALPTAAASVPLGRWGIEYQRNEKFQISIAAGLQTSTCIVLAKIAAAHVCYHVLRLDKGLEVTNHWPDISALFT